MNDGIFVRSLRTEKKGGEKREREREKEINVDKGRASIIDDRVRRSRDRDEEGVSSREESQLMQRNGRETESCRTICIDPRG